MSITPKIVILAGGRGTRLAEETDIKPKPMVEVGDRPILWHIMKHYAAHGLTEFYLALGYKGHLIKRYFLDEVQLTGDLTVETANRQVLVRPASSENWTVHLCDTGLETSTGGRLKRLAPQLRGGTFLLTYGDGVSDVPIDKLLAFHRNHGRLATVTAVRPPARFGGLVFEGDLVKVFVEKPQIGEGWINGGFLVFEPDVLDMIEGDSASLESQLLEHLAREGQLAAYRHEGFWQCMDTVRDLRLLQSLWDAGRAPWRTWDV
jgi:glucose-1-phosphate cytidylyltransferase